MARINYDFEKTILGQYNTARNRVMLEKQEQAANYFKKLRQNLDEEIARKGAQMTDENILASQRQRQTADVTDAYTAQLTGESKRRVQTADVTDARVVAETEGIEAGTEQQLQNLKEQQHRFAMQEQSERAMSDALNLSEGPLIPLAQHVAKRAEGRGKEWYLSKKDVMETKMGGAKAHMEQIDGEITKVKDLLSQWESQGLGQNPAARGSYEQLLDRLAKLSGMAREGQQSYLDAKTAHTKEGTLRQYIPGLSRAMISGKLQEDASWQRMRDQIGELDSMREGLSRFTQQLPAMGPASPYTSSAVTGQIYSGPYQAGQSYPYTTQQSLSNQVNK